MSRRTLMTSVLQSRTVSTRTTRVVDVLVGILSVSLARKRCCQAFSSQTSFDPFRSFSSRQHRYQQSSSILFCQLLGMNSATATEFALSWPSFCRRGGETDIHADGWGLAFYDGPGLRQFHDVEAASTSPLAQFLGSQEITTRNLMAHIRFATTGTVELANVHPFQREMWGVNWAFCHNGHVPLLVDHPDVWLGLDSSVYTYRNENLDHITAIKRERFYYPVGTTDSEATFCAILNALRHEFPTTMPSLPVLYDSLKKLCDELVKYDPQHTILNFLLTCGPHVLWVFSWPGRRPNSDTWNGLHYTVRQQLTKLKDDDYSVKVRPKKKGKKKQKVTVVNGEGAIQAHRDTNPERNDAGEDEEGSCCIVATTPLTTDEEWIELQPGELIVMDNGRPRVSHRELFQVELSGHGLEGAKGRGLRPPRLEEDMRRYQFQPEFFLADGI